MQGAFGLSGARRDAFLRRRRLRRRPLASRANALFHTEENMISRTKASVCASWAALGVVLGSCGSPPQAAAPHATGGGVSLGGGDSAQAALKRKVEACPPRDLDPRHRPVEVRLSADLGGCLPKASRLSLPELMVSPGGTQRPVRTPKRPLAAAGIGFEACDDARESWVSVPTRCRARARWRRKVRRGLGLRRPRR